MSLSDYGADAGAPQIAMNDAGAAVVAWTSYRGPRSRVQSASRSAGGVLQAPVTLSRGDDEADGAQAAIDEAGAAIVVWASERGSRSRVMAAWRPAGARRFTQPVALSAPAARVVSPQVAVNAAGEAIVTWGQFNGRRFIVQVASRAAGGAFTSPVPVSGPLEQLAGGVRSVLPKASIDAAGNAIVVWERVRGEGGIIEAALRARGGRFAPPVKLSRGAESFAPALATNARGETVVAWYARASDGANLAVLASIRSPGGAFGEPADLSGPEAVIYGPSVSIGDAGDALVAWSTVDPDVVDAAVRAPGGPFVPFGISPRGQNGFDPTVAVNAAGAMAAVWTTGKGLDGVAGALRPTAGGAFAVGGLATGFPGPDVAIDGSGRAIVVWSRGPGPRRSVVAAGSGDLGVLLRAGLPSVRAFGLTRARLRAARAGPSFGASAAPRTVASVTLDAPASVLFSVERATPGRSAFGVCFSVNRNNRALRPCTRFLSIGRHRVALPAGRARLRFSGRLDGRPLRPGRYRLAAVPSAAGRRGDAAHASFTIVR